MPPARLQLTCSRILSRPKSGCPVSTVRMQYPTQEAVFSMPDRIWRKNELPRSDAKITIAPAFLFLRLLAIRLNRYPAFPQLERRWRASLR